MIVRPAGAADLESLVRLRLANAEAHIALEPSVYRMPSREAVVDHFTSAVASTSDAILVAEIGGRVVGMIEVLRRPDPPDHQILRPEPSAFVHTVVLPEARGHEVGAALLAAGERWAAAAGVRHLSAGIHHANAGAVRFYGRHGYHDSGLSLGKRLTD
ncbi:GNAT family N-acetyltransferase [Umezawaea sp. Da 62-37]|uniref:GNAT family N-acetyltransferase n=1 Tax=Umezawaea sp. Da 62-37 TaxID=3075927 RepID=UPI0028F74D08|nr:GNAT family N-acetyltransferase [Umezawaea sp. Da 62-37]WNV88619.1 GNAT family N-acetyltransferase [Umezawaea sp. Da 62-37]